MKISSFFLIIYLALSFSAEADHLERMQERTGIPDPTEIYHIEDHAISSYDSGNLKGAFDWFTKWAAFGDPYGQFRLAKMYFGGVGVVKDHKQAAKWFLASAKQFPRISVAQQSGLRRPQNQD